MGKVASKGINMMSRVIKGERASRIEQIVKEVSKNNFKIDGFEVSAPLYNSLIEEDGVQINQKVIIVYSVDGGSWNEYESLSRLSQTLSTPVVFPSLDYLRLQRAVICQRNHATSSERVFNSLIKYSKGLIGALNSNLNQNNNWR